jgi:hypothetical protein
MARHTTDTISLRRFIGYFIHKIRTIYYEKVIAENMKEFF